MEACILFILWGTHTCPALSIVYSHRAWQPIVTPLDVFPFFCCVVPAPDVRYCLQLELDQPRQVLRPARHSKHESHFRIGSLQSQVKRPSIGALEGYFGFDVQDEDSLTSFVLRINIRWTVLFTLYTVCMQCFSEVYPSWFVVMRLITKLQFEKERASAELNRTLYPVLLCSWDCYQYDLPISWKQVLIGFAPETVNHVYFHLIR